MADPTKFTEEELKSISELQSKYNQITMAAGQLALSKLSIKQREAKLEETLEDTRKEENEV